MAKKFLIFWLSIILLLFLYSLLNAKNKQNMSRIGASIHNNPFNQWMYNKSYNDSTNDVYIKRK